MTHRGFKRCWLALVLLAGCSSSGTNGTHTTDCPGGLSSCGGVCVDTSSDAVHCGDCDIACASGQDCNSGVCSGGSGTGGTAGSGATGGSSGGSGGTGAGATGGSSGGSGGTGGTTGGTGGTTGGTGGTTGGTGGTTGSLTPQQAATQMSPGFNLGNSFDATPNETSWGNPTPNQGFINAVHSAGFKTLRLPVSWTDHIGAAPSYTINAAWMAKVKQTAQWAIDAGMYVFINVHHDSDGNNGGWVTFPSTTSAAQTVAAEVTAVWTQIATTFQSFDSRLMLECFNEPSLNTGNNTQTRADLNLYLEACYSAIRSTGGGNATRIVMIQPIGASPIQAGIQAMQQVSFINDPNVVISLHTYYPTNFGLSQTRYAWGSSSDYTSMQNSVQQIRGWLPTQVVFIGEWGSMGAQVTANRAAHALAYAQDTTTANLVPIWWDNGGSGNGSYALFTRNAGTPTYPTILSGLMTGVANGLLSPNNWATLANP